MLEFYSSRHEIGLFMNCENQYYSLKFFSPFRLKIDATRSDFSR